MKTDAAYYEQRERDERALAAAATDPKVRGIHLDMAAMYAKFAQQKAA